MESLLQRASALMLLPEEYPKSKGRLPLPFYIKDAGTGTSIWDNDVEHVEFRMLSSEYAHDPILNLFMSLYSAHTGLEDTEAREEGTFKKDFKLAVEQLVTDFYLRDVLGESTLQKLAKVVSQYPDVSARNITVDQIQQA